MGTYRIHRYKIALAIDVDFLMHLEFLTNKKGKLMKKIYTVFLILIIFGCSDVKSTYLPEKISIEHGDAELDEIAKKLPMEDYSELYYWIETRITDDDGNYMIGEGVTIGEAINLGRERSEHFSNQAKEFEDNHELSSYSLDLNEPSIYEIKAEFVGRIDNFDLLRKEGFSEITYKFTNNSNSAVDGIKGVFSFFDPFDDLVLAIEFNEFDFYIPANESRSAVRYYNINDMNPNPFNDQETKFYDIPSSKVRYRFDVESVIFTDGADIPPQLNSPDIEEAKKNHNDEELWDMGYNEAEIYEYH